MPDAPPLVVGEPEELSIINIEMPDYVADPVDDSVVDVEMTDIMMIDAPPSELLLCQGSPAFTASPLPPTPVPTVSAGTGMEMQLCEVEEDQSLVVNETQLQVGPFGFSPVGVPVAPVPAPAAPAPAPALVPAPVRAPVVAPVFAPSVSLTAPTFSSATEQPAISFACAPSAQPSTRRNNKPRSSMARRARAPAPVSQVSSAPVSSAPTTSAGVENALDFLRGICEEWIDKGALYMLDSQLCKDASESWIEGWKQRCQDGLDDEFAPGPADCHLDNVSGGRKTIEFFKRQFRRRLDGPNEAGRLAALGYFQRLGREYDLEFDPVAL
ncbi:hypothetical protein B0J18DRAFT_122235 [Chaetomium sp. MPI-SDFR-AT-0129]|nr:hypothetical protein B0J18DRAFT_122235 [Chaetomium sp. MPI-SDFR-AT-0129]